MFEILHGSTYSCYEEYTDFKNYMRDISDVRYANVAAENELVGDERKFSAIIKASVVEFIFNKTSCFQCFQHD